ncbi:BamA/TamA family outer membrane protein [Croceivirga sp. JEA036]|uniref:translocation and assembly module lipoprotein TamL n=1 Tax=Croceivirga sp. JEA036 TaxID=2721162 RepID=UPI00293C0BD6|nr:BamA/TamA family outer membrane protein [Croceivirga sp. JEA036]
MDTLTEMSVYRNNKAKIVLLLVVMILASCNTVKKVGDDQYLLTENKILIDSLPEKRAIIQNLISQKPNTNILGYNLRLNLYNLAKENTDSTYQAWLDKKPKRRERLTKILSAKQVERLGESFVIKGFNEFLKNAGEPPVIIDTAKTNKSVERLEGYYTSKGYFNSKANYTITPAKRKKRAMITYNVTRNKPYFVDSLTHIIAAKELDSIYLKHLESTTVKEGQQFDLDNFNSERERLTTLYRNSGVYNFQESSINFDIVRDTVQANDDQNMDIVLNVENPRSANDSTTAIPYRVNRFEKINIYADYRFDSNIAEMDTIQHENYTIYFKDKLRYSPEALTNAIFFEKDSVYRDLDYIRTNRQVTNLNTFKYPNIDLNQGSQEGLLVADVYLAARPKYSLDASFELTRSNIQQLGIGFGGSVITRNVFGGAETLSVSGRGAIGFLDSEIANESISSELGGDINLTFPRIWLPFNTEKWIPYYMLPQTRLSIGTNFQNNIGLDRQSLNSVLEYSWSPTTLKKHNLELLNIEFVDNTDINDFFNVYNTTYDNLDAVADQYQDAEEYPELAKLFRENDNAADNLQLSIPQGTDGFIDIVTSPGFTISTEDLQTVRSIEERKNRLTSNNLIFTTAYTYTQNNRADLTDNEFYQFRAKVESAGNLLSLTENIIPFEQSESGEGLVFGVPYSQYLKGELDFIKHWELAPKNIIAMRSFVGLAVPYGNADNIPFVRSYFGGGSNDNRAWRVYSLGPGRTDQVNDFNEANFKIALNAEYRFPIFGDVNGALFTDVGNIWNVFDNVEDPNAQFTGIKSLRDLAIGSGFGLRYDLSYFVIRLDLGLKTYNPALEIGDRWFTDFNLGEAVWNIGINYPF